MPRALITGSGGLLAPFLAEAFVDCELYLSGRRGGALSADLTHAPEVRSLLDMLRPDIVVHAAALADVDKCEASPENAFRANAMAVSLIATALPSDARLVLVSTDQVYSGKKAPHREADASPVNEYGRSKLAGEWAAFAAHANTVALRTNFFGESRTPGRESLSDFFIRGFTDGTRVSLFEDALFSPLSAPTLARIVRRLADESGPRVFNVGSRDGFSKAQFARAVAAHKGLETANAVPTHSTDLRNRAPRPLDLRMDVSALEAFLGQKMPALSDEIRTL